MGDGWLSSFIEIVGGIFVTIGGGFITRHAIRLDKMQADQKKTADALAKHELYSEKHFAKEETMQFSLNRIHDRLDLHAREARDMNAQSRGEVREMNNELRNDIKKLLELYGKHI